ncbi:mannosyltransferase [Zobellia uliginosa]|uniref:mannosyltransferase n=1 Tax=Zobellia uliginosa TaxID=143224 RepID=UPI001C074674|nr:mannosyltransferase [Zobellia uliginosa]MBU2948721.1 mannosyltransferase [Zobellia uliginosa]
MPNRFTTYWKLHQVSILMALLAAIFYYTFAFHLERTDFIKLLTLFAASFFLCFKLIQFEKWNFKFLLVAGIIFRLIFLTTEPNLSQDYFRFVWDGHLVANFINPYLEVPNDLIAQSDLVIPNAQLLYDSMGSLSAKHFSNYPPLNQLLFAIAALIGGKSLIGSVLAIKTMIILADVGIFYFGRKLLKNLNHSPHLIFWYFLNPLIIIELTGNLHFEGVMLFFFVWALHLLSTKKWALAAIPYALSICVKLVPLLFLPLFLKHLGFKKSISFYSIIGITCLLLFVPFYSPDFIANYSKTVGLWFSNFEFNAGIYNVVKYIAIQYDGKPWELIKTYGKITPIVTILFVLLFTFLRDNQKIPTLITSMMAVLTLYYFMSATVHPWYIIFLVVLGVFTRYKYAVLWSATVVLSYYAYSQADFKENLTLITVEYISVYVFLIYEIFNSKEQFVIFRKN